MQDLDKCVVRYYKKEGEDSGSDAVFIECHLLLFFKSRSNGKTLGN